MKLPFLKRFCGGIAWAIALATACPVRASSLVYMTTAQMARIAPLIVRARCIGSSSRWDGGEIWSFTSFAVEETWRGQPTRRVTLRLLGGSVGPLTSHVPGVPRFLPGEDVVLFLEPISGGDFSAVGWQEGTFRIHADARRSLATVTQDSAGVETFDPVTKRFVNRGATDLPLSALHAQVNAALRQATEARP